MSEPLSHDTAENGCFVDAHIHIYPDVDPGAVLTAAARNMDKEAHRRGWGRRRPGMLLLTENAGLDVFATLVGSVPGWIIAPTQEEVSLLATPQDGGAPLAIVSGRQIVTAENIEIHALGTRASFPDGLPAETLLSEVQASGAVAVLPWGVGKWSGRRGALIRRLIEHNALWPGLMVADSGVRPKFLARPALLNAAETRGLKVIAGSDPLPIPAEASKPGRFGFIAPCGFDPDHPFAKLKAWLAKTKTSPELYGTLECAPAFMHRQIVIQLRKRFG